MPSRKSSANEVHADRRSSLHRLSSIASLQALFSRRRSGNAVNNHNTASSSSELSLQSPVTKQPETHKQTNPLTSDSNDVEGIADLPSHISVPQHRSSRKASYVCLPDDPIGGMPRSRTLSNLPLPVRGRKGIPASSSSRSHSRLHSSQVLPTRLPTPPASTRQHSHSRLESAGYMSPLPCQRNQLQRSDTEPLLKSTLEQHDFPVPRLTAFKENISLSPVRALPQMANSYDFKIPRNVVQRESLGAEQKLTSSLSSPDRSSFQDPVLAYANHPAIRLARENKSSPVYQKIEQAKVSPVVNQGTNLQRWASQPALVQAKDHRNPQYGAIKQARLMSARQAPTPPPPKTPMSTQALLTSHLRGRRDIGLPLIETPDRRQSLSETPKTAPANLCALEVPPSSKQEGHDDRTSKIHQVTEAQSMDYWSGRLSSLVDSYRNSDLATLLAKKASKSETDQMHHSEANSARLRRALQNLQDFCVTREATDSLEAFQRQFAAKLKMPELSRPIKLGSCGDGKIHGAGAEDGMISESRRASFMDRLLGRQKRKSLLLPS